MNIEEIRKGAPNGATHYRLRRTFGVCYYIQVGEIYFSMDNPSRYSLEHESIKPL